MSEYKPDFNSTNWIKRGATANVGENELFIEPKRTFLVLGPESSGTRLFAKILINSGCAGSDDHYQTWDWETPTGDKIMWRRSVPHAEWFPDIVGMAETLRKEKYQVFAYVMTRDWRAMLSSQMERRQVGSYDLCFRRVQKAYPYIFWQLDHASIPFVVVSYEALTLYEEPQRKAYIDSMLKFFGLAVSELPDIHSENDKHYDCDASDYTVVVPDVENLTKVEIRPEVHC